MSKELSPETCSSSAYLALLRGSQGYHIASLLSFALSIVVVLVGIFSLEVTREQKLLAVISTLFLISTTFTLAKTMRDQLQASLWDDPLLAGTTSWLVQCCVSFGIAIVANGYTALSLDTTWSIRSFVLLGFGFALSSSVSLAKLVRDQQDADCFAARMTTPASTSSLPPPSVPSSSFNGAASFESIRMVLRQTLGVHLPIAWGFFVVNLLSFFGALFQFDLNAC